MQEQLQETRFCFRTRGQSEIDVDLKQPAAARSCAHDPT